MVKRICDICGGEINTVSDNLLGVLNRCMEKARYGAAEPIEEEEAEE